MKDGTTKSGYYFGSTLVPPTAEQDKLLFLPAAGFRDTDMSSGITTTRYVAECGFYWSSSTQDNTNGKSWDFYSANVAISPYDKGRGYSIRCVKDKPKKRLPEHAIEVAGVDFYVADGNVKAVSEDSGGYTYVFAEEQGYYNSHDSYFCWNTLEPTGSVTQASWDDARDVCRKIDDGIPLVVSGISECFRTFLSLIRGRGIHRDTPP